MNPNFKLHVGEEFVDAGEVASESVITLSKSGKN